MKHLGDIRSISGYDVPTVEVIIGGSPCQDLSVAGKRAGLDGERSGLFMEQIRLIREMRENDRANERTDEFIRPRFMVWENVPGAFSSNGGEDFRIVLEETVRAAEPTAVIPRPPKNKWTNAGCIMGDGWSVAWRVFDAQFWGVPQRRRRIALVADFGGECAPPILFERKGLPGDIAESREQGQEAAADARNGIDSAISLQERAGKPGGVKESSYSTIESAHSQPSTIKPSLICLNDQGGSVMSVSKDKSGTLRAQEHGHQPAICYGISAYESNAMKSNNPNSGVYLAETARTLDNNGGSPACNQGGIAVVESYALENHPADSRVKLSGEVVQTLSSQMGTGGGNTPMVMIKEDNNATGTQTCNKEKRNCYVVRRLTPLEAERLQGFPDGWTDIGDWTDSKGKKHKAADSPRYKALGNSIALPSWMWVLNRLNKYCKEHTMASLFDGIGGFPLIWETLNGRGSCLWASEIEEFPMAVTKIRFGGE